MTFLLFAGAALGAAQVGGPVVLQAAVVVAWRVVGT